MTKVKYFLTYHQNVVDILIFLIKKKPMRPGSAIILLTFLLPLNLSEDLPSQFINHLPVEFKFTRNINTLSN